MRARPLQTSRTACTVATLALWATQGACTGQSGHLQLPPPAAQNPSPMVEETRTHERLVQRTLDGALVSFTGPAGRPVALFIPAPVRARDTVDLVVHFHGAAWLPQQ